MPSTLKCGACGALNRVLEKSGKVAICGRCGKSLKSVGAVRLTTANFSELVEKSSIPVVVDFWAGWCGPCRVMAPTIDKLAVELDGKALVAKLDIDAEPSIAARFQVQSIPTVIIFMDGREADRMVGVQSREAILKRLDFSR